MEVYMIDIHCHVLPGFDDGAEDEANALAMLKIATDSGIRAVVATPHVIEGAWLPSWEKIVSACQSLQESACRQGLSIEIYPGAEVAVNMDILDLISNSGEYCLNGGNYMLVELPSIHIPTYVDEFLFLLQARHITPIIAHPERHPAIGRDPEILRRWERRGILAQVNATSITGKSGHKVQKVAEFLLCNNLAHAVGSDAHGIKHRLPELNTAEVKMLSLLSPEVVYRLLYYNPMHFVESLAIKMIKSEVTVSNQSQGLWQRLLSRF